MEKGVVYVKFFVYSALAFFISACLHRHPIQVLEFKAKPVLNTIIRDLNFFPNNGERFRLSELENKKAVVIIMRERDCPISEKYGPRLARLEKKYSPLGIQFIYNYVGQLEPVKKWQKRFRAVWI